MATTEVTKKALERLRKEKEFYEEDLVKLTREMDRLKIDGEHSRCEYQKSKIEETREALYEVERKIKEFEAKL